MRKMLKMSIAAAMVMGIGSVSAQAEDGIDILSNVKFKGQIRPRFQMTDDAGSALDAGVALTNRTNLNVSGDLLGVDGLKATIELNAVNDFGDSDKTSAQKAQEADVAKLSQSNITYNMAGNVAVLGRTTVNLDNQRFIGSVGWKQNFQTLDLVGVMSRGSDLEYTAAYVYGVNAIGDDGFTNKNLDYAAGTTSGATQSVALNASYNVSPELKVTVYDYMLASFGDTIGVALSGKAAGVSYRVEYAMLGDASFETDTGGPAVQDATYMNVDLGMNLDGILLGVNYEVQSGTDGSDGLTTFKTPLATKHKFNGWADMFLGTPSVGLVDTNVMVGYTAKDFGTAKIIYHTFAADAVTGDYGTEIDFLYKKGLSSNLTAMLKGAMFTADAASGMNDTSKYWLMFDYKFASK